MDPIQLLVWVIVLVILVIVIFWLLNHLGHMFIAPLVGHQQEIMYHDNGGVIQRSVV